MAALNDLIKGREVTCMWIEESSRLYTNQLPRAMCTTAQTCDEAKCLLNWEMIRRGWAVSQSYRIWYTNDRRAHNLIQAQKEAPQDRTGILQGRVRLPKGLQRRKSG